MNRKAYALLAVTAALVALVVAPGSTARARTQVVTVRMTEFRFAFSTKAVHPGKVTFRLLNKGKLTHDLRIAGKTSAKVQPGKTGVLVVTLKKGKYPYLCTVPGHAAAGMKGVLTVP